MLPMGLKMENFTKVNKLIFTTLQFDFEDELSRDNKIFNMKLYTKKTSLKNKSKKSNPRGSKKKNV